MVGCGAPRRNVSRLSPSILLIFPVKRQRRYGSCSPPFFFFFLVFFSLQTFACLHVANTHSWRNKVSTVNQKLRLIDTKNLLIITDLNDCAYCSLKMDSLSLPPLPRYFPPLLSTFYFLPQHLSSLLFKWFLKISLLCQIKRTAVK